MFNLSPDVVEQIRKALQRPEGSFTFNFTSAQLFDPDAAGGYLFEIASGTHVFRLERSSDFCLRFYHASPGTGTRVATIKLSDVDRADATFFALTWSPSAIALHIAPRTKEQKLISADGVPAAFQLRVGTDGRIYQVGDVGLEVMGMSVFQDGKALVTPTAIEAWAATGKAIGVLQGARSTSEHAHLLDVVIANLTLSALVTGFEAYTKTRFRELEDEGITPRIDELLRVIVPRREREAGYLEILATEAAEAESSLLAYVVGKGMINFQNYDDCKRAYNKAYAIKFGELGLDGEIMERMPRYIRFRHRVVHVSPLLAMLNQADCPPEEPVFSTREFARQSAADFDSFIVSLHQATLRVRT